MRNDSYETITRIICEISSGLDAQIKRDEAFVLRAKYGIAIAALAIVAFILVKLING